MNEEKEKKSSGILSSLKKLIFEDAPEPEAVTPNPSVAPVIPANKATAPATPPPLPVQPANTVEAPVSDVKQMKLKVLEMLEKLNEPGIDFFEVWNAAAEMGNVDASTLKAAFTSLKYVDKSLNKEKLTSSAQRYVAALQKVIDRETSQKQQQQQTLQQNLVQEKASLSGEIAQLEKQLETLREQLRKKETDLKEINSKYEPQLREIDSKIAIGNSAVAEVVKDIQHALQLIESSII
ncbi:hypothetical protein [Chitinophaga nivalis]|uniref:Uncharacterized protein n=1 Tax=Chitinophaga nivalis TaxID=2991709 RepID=A0ABT3IKD4_9BACT|nr:hypothetical protein [Chitinophaga nivalis]MCW3465885.1 hypothetical protein [Chitinophaga nivalis]MCW3484424.1 hypothetical protein [Chitinophaga nivalis]